MSLYFIMQVIVIWLVNREVKRLQYEERALKKGAPVKHKIARGVVTVMKKALLDDLKTSKAYADKKSPELDALIDAGKLNVTEFVDRTSDPIVQKFIEFPARTWFGVLLTTIFITLVTQFGCFPSIVVNLGWPILNTLIALFFLLFLGLERYRMVHGRVPVDFPIFSKLFWPFHILLAVPFSMGHVPWKSKPSDGVLVRTIQTHVFFICLITMWGWADETSSFYYHHDGLDGGLLEMIGPYVELIAVHTILTIICIFVACVMQAFAVSLAAFPPYVSEKEKKVLIEVLEEYPDGIPETDEEVTYKTTATANA